MQILKKFLFLLNSREKKTSILSYEEVVNHFNILESYSIPNYGAFSTSVKENVNYKICLEHIGNVLLWVFQNKNN